MHHNYIENQTGEFLERNLEALVNVKPKLVRRISWPVRGEHVVIDNKGQVLYILHSSEYEMSLGEDKVSTECLGIGNSKDIFVFGVGLGEQIDFLLTQFPDKKIRAWDRDPWLVRLLLMNRDYSEHLQSGKLDLLMCGDLIRILPRMNDFDIVYHPLLKQLYENEVDLIGSGVTEKRILVNAKGLFVDDVVESLGRRGYSALYLDMTGISVNEIENCIIQFMPSLVFSVNYYEGLSELCEKFSLPLMCWEVDPCLDVVAPSSAKNERSFIFTFRKRNQMEYLSAGFSKSYHLPLAANCRKRRPQSLSEDDMVRYTADVSFVGDSMVRQAEKCETLLTGLIDEFRGYDWSVASDAEEKSREILEIQKGDYSAWQVPELCKSMMGTFMEFIRARNGFRYDPVKLLGERAASDKRLSYLFALGKYKPKVWGDKGWRAAESEGVRYMGFAGHKRELNKIYNASMINVDINRLYQADMVNMRVFDIMACGGFVMAEYSEQLEELFALDREVVVYGSLEELDQKVEYYLSHVEEARKIGQSGMRAVCDRHTIDMRVDYMLETMTRELSN